MVWDYGLRPWPEFRSPRAGGWSCLSHIWGSWWGWKAGQQQNLGPENQDSQHMLNQPRGSFPEKGSSLSSENEDTWAMTFCANKTKTEVRHFCLKLSKTRCTPVKRDIKLPAQKVQGMVNSRTRLNEIRTRQQFAEFEGIEGQDRAAFSDTLGFPGGGCQMPWNTSKPTP